MRKKLNILMVASEMTPFIKTGGLADIIGSLPQHIKQLGHDVRIVIPKYSDINFKNHDINTTLNIMGVWMGNTIEWCSVFMTKTKDNITVYFIEHHLYFSRPGLYHDSLMNDYTDNPKRFAFLTRAALQLCKDIKYKPDIVHSHDWQTALAPAYLKIWDFNDQYLGNTASILTIHNAAYQGIYPKSNYNYIGLGKQNFSADTFECYGGINLLKGGIFFSDIVNTVSPTYAKEISRPFSNFGLAPYLSNKKDSFFGILNGVDYNEWSPEKDSIIPANYSVNNLLGKAKCKLELQKKLNLNQDNHIALIGAIGRFVDQKGFNLISEVLHNVLSNMHVQFVILGSGDPFLESFFTRISEGFKGKAASYIGFSNELAHLIQGGCDFLLMPSLYEPCGLNQIYSLKYGTLPIVRATGGLYDTVDNYDEHTGKGTGFKFWEPSPKALYYTIGWAISTYYDRPQHINKLIRSAMSKDFSWDKSSKKYESAYNKAINNKKQYDYTCSTK